MPVRALFDRAHSARALQKLYLGNLDGERDWGYAPEFVEGIWRMLQQDEPEDFLLATGETHSVREFVERAFAKWAWTGAATSKWTRNIIGPQKLTGWKVIPRRRERNSAGRRQPNFATW